MKKFLLFFSLLVAIITNAEAQFYGRFVDVPTTNNEHTEYRVINFPNRKIFTSRDSTMFRFYVDTVAFNNLIGRNEGTPNKLLWIDTNGILHTSTAPYLIGTDTTSLSNRINLKLNIPDTTNRWAPRGNYIYPTDTSVFLPKNLAAAIYQLKGTYLLPADTVGKWAPKGTYIVPSDTVNKWVNINGVYTNPSFIGSLAYSKLTGTPTIPSTTTQISEGTNLYYTDTRARTAISLTTNGTTGACTYNSSTGVLNVPIYASYTDYVDSAVVSGGAGNAVFYLTNNHTSGGTALYTNVSYINPIINDPTLNYSYGWTVSADKKTLTVNARAAVGINVALVGLTLLGVPSNVPNGTKIYVLVKGN